MKLKDNNRLTNSGINNFVWAKPAYSSTDYVYNLEIASEQVNPSDPSSRWNGFSIRCLAR